MTPSSTTSPTDGDAIAEADPLSLIAAMTYEMRLRLRNERQDELAVHLEPWGEQHTLAPGEHIELVFNADAPGVAEIEESGSRTTVYGWPGAIVAVQRG